MSECGCEERCRNPSGGNGYRRVLVVALVMNLALFFVEIAGAWSSGSVSLLADAIDFLGDSVNFGASLLALGMAMVWSSRLALAKGIVMSSWGVMVLARAIWAFSDGGVPVHETMTWISLLALATNVAVALALPPPRGRRQSQVGLAVRAKRRIRERRGACGGPGCGFHWAGMARPSCCKRDGWPWIEFWFGGRPTCAKGARGAGMMGDCLIVY